MAEVDLCIACMHTVRGQLQLYLLIHLLHQEAINISLQCRLVAMNRLRAYQHRKYTCQTPEENFKIVVSIFYG